jgi:hypothetical protein
MAIVPTAVQQSEAPIPFEATPDHDGTSFSDMPGFRLGASHVHPRPWWAAAATNGVAMRAEKDSMGTVLVPADRYVELQLFGGAMGTWGCLHYKYLYVHV